MLSGPVDICVKSKGVDYANGHTLRTLATFDRIGRSLGVERFLHIVSERTKIPLDSMELYWAGTKLETGRLVDLHLPSRAVMFLFHRSYLSPPSSVSSASKEAVLKTEERISQSRERLRRGSNVYTQDSKSWWGGLSWMKQKKLKTSLDFLRRTKQSKDCRRHAASVCVRSSVLLFSHRGLHCTKLGSKMIKLIRAMETMTDRPLTGGGRRRRSSVRRGSVSSTARRVSSSSVRRGSVSSTARRVSSSSVRRGSVSSTARRVSSSSNVRRGSVSSTTGRGEGDYDDDLDGFVDGPDIFDSDGLSCRDGFRKNLAALKMLAVRDVAELAPDFVDLRRSFLGEDLQTVDADLAKKILKQLDRGTSASFKLPGMWPTSPKNEDSIGADPSLAFKNDKNDRARGSSASDHIADAGGFPDMSSTSSEAEAASTVVIPRLSLGGKGPYEANAESSELLSQISSELANNLASSNAFFADIRGGESGDDKRNAIIADFRSSMKKPDKSIRSDAYTSKTMGRTKNLTAAAQRGNQILGSRAGRGFTRSALEAAFEAADVDGSGTLDSHEVANVIVGLKSHASSSGTDAASSIRSAMERATGVIDEFDVDGDGFLDFDEFCSLMRKIEREGTAI